MAYSKDAKQSKDGRLLKTRSYLEACIERIKKIPVRESDDSVQEELPAKSADEVIQEEIVKNPKMNASTFYNLLKSIGIKFDKGSDTAPTKEADSSSSMPQMTRKKESAEVILGNLNFRTRSLKFVEADKPKDGFVGFTKFGSVLIKEGMGNFGDKYFYSKDALKSAVSVFEGKKSYADHPSQSDEFNRPERSVRDIFGYFTNLKYQETDGRGELYAELEVLPTKAFDWARDLMTAAVQYSEKYPDKDFVGLSINASGDAQPVSVDSLLEAATNEEIKTKLLKAKESGITELNVVNKIDDAISCDLVTEAGAGGRIKELMEGKQTMTKEKKEAADADALKAKQAAEEKAAAEKAKENKEAGAKEDEAAPVVDDESADSDGQHDDADQDIELIKKMIAKYMGDDTHESTPEECGMVKETYEACKEMGCKEDEAAEKAVHQLKLAKHMASKKESAEEKPVEESDDSKADDGNEDKGSNVDDKKVKESNTKLIAENAALKAKLGQYDVQKQIEKVCKESGLKTETTKRFREAVAGSKSVDDVNKTWKTWKSAFDAASETVVVHDFMESITNGEKQVVGGNTSHFADQLKD